MQWIKKTFSVLLRISISIILLVFLFSQVDKKVLFEVIRGANKPLLLIGLLIFFFNYLFCLIRWIILLKAADIHLPLKRIVISFSGGVFFNLILPSTIGGDLMRSLDLAAHTKKPKEIVATVLLDRLSGYIGLVLMAVAALVVGWKMVRDNSIILSIGIISLLLVAILLVLFNNTIYSRINRFLGASGAGRIKEMIRSLHQEIHIFRSHRKMILKNIGLSLLVQLTSPLSFYFIALALNIKIGLIYFFVYLPIIGAITLLPISIGGLGLRDASTIFFFAKAGVTKDLAFAMSLISFVFVIFYGAIGGLIYVLTIHHRRLQPAQPPAS
ncbi:MAG: lysylphosphatidylglycerol synthase transmembrane domain-containing protein [Candidatus Omnitrophica bacterium]|nr:lysylphosphatidylglycerol synthase transmembrane domain-containing protein [Candidatus Omnitrophota bacterium]MDD5512838.1 lysylphosphatidylglycerol synthase transmembrane domain-containing protein [Candidatus Omnitrophota bacterium]